MPAEHFERIFRGFLEVPLCFSRMVCSSSCVIFSALHFLNFRPACGAYADDALVFAVRAADGALRELAALLPEESAELVAPELHEIMLGRGLGELCGLGSVAGLGGFGGLGGSGGGAGLGLRASSAALAT